MALIIKAYLSEENGTELIKRFAIDADVTTSYEYLLRKILMAYPSLNGKNTMTYWRDREGDMILFSSDEELIQALSQVDDGILKVYLKIKSQPIPNIPNFPPFMQGGFPFASFFPPSETHPGVVCDGCEGAVKGMRFKCQQCEDFDLCTSCKQKGLHGEHKFREIQTPVNMMHEFATKIASQFAANGNSASNKKAENQQVPDETKMEFEEHLKNVGKCVEAMLEPLGIKFDIDVCSQSKPAENKSATEVNKPNCCEKTATKCAEKKCCDKMASNCKNNSSSIQGNDVEMVDANIDEKLLKNPCCKSFMGPCNSNAGNLNPKDTQVKVGAGIPLVEKIPATDSRACKSPASNCWVEIDETMFPGEEENLHSLSLDKKIRDSVSKLKGMGFNDEGGWLTALITATKGDVNKALDLMHAKP